MLPLLVIWPVLSGDFLKQESGNKGFITGYSESSAKKTELCKQPEKAEGKRGQISSPGDIPIRKEIGKSAALSANGSTVGQVWVALK